MLRNKNTRWSKENVLLFQERWKAVTIPINIKIDLHQTALPLEQVLFLIRSAEQISVTDCFCRTELQNCDFPRKVCLSLNNLAITNVNDGSDEFVSKAEAEQIILKAHQSGLVHLALHHPADDEKNIQAICSCCSCCCSVFQGLFRLNMSGLVQKSPYLSIHDPDKCANCGECASTCHFMARTLNEGGDMMFDSNRCFGCGLCVTSCPEDAIVMIKRVLA